VISDWKDKSTVLFATTGYTGRELYETGDHPNNLYMVGSMGCVSPLALGVALTKKNSKVVALDGDGALLMRMGAITTNAYYSPDNMLHILFDNNAHLSTGGQYTVSNNVNFVELMASVGYKKSIYLHSIDELKYELENWDKNRGLTFLYLRVSQESRVTMRPTMKPYEVKDRLRNFLENVT